MYTAYELFNVAEDRLKAITQILEERKSEGFYLTNQQRSQIDERLKSLKINPRINSNLMFSAIFRGAVDARAQGVCKIDLIERIISEVGKNDKI